jgi:hypothetical protein
VARVQLGRVTGNLEVPRGPDVTHKVRVKPEWLEVGATIEFELPRNLSCAACKGGGCDKCDRSGAITIRDRGEPGELVTVTLPRHTPDLETTASGRGVIVRIPERGGLPESPKMPRGLLLLSVSPAQIADVTLVETALPPEIVPSKHPTLVPARRLDPLVIALAILVVLLLAYLAWLRFSGRA